MNDWDEVFDVVVVGFGFAGGASAIAASDAGARVLLIEKMANPGGISICSAGGVRTTSDPEAAFEYLKATNAGTAPDANLRALANGMATVGDFIDRLAAINGAQVIRDRADGNYPFEGFRAFGFISIGEVPGFEPPTDFPYVRGLRGGARLFKVVYDNVAARPIELRLSTSAVELVRNMDDAVEGLVVVNEGRQRRIRAKGGVILACGGFEAAEDMKIQYWQERPVAPAAFPGNTGDGIRLAQGVGAALWHMWHYHGTYGMRHVDHGYPYGIRLTRFPDWTPGATVPPESDLPTFFAAKRDMRMPWIVVDQTGRRYMNEYPPYPGDTGHRPMAFFDPLTQTYPRIPSHLIVDRQGFEKYELGFPTYNDPDMEFQWSPSNAKELDLGIITRGETIEGLASVINVDVSRLRETLERWNRFCRDGCDRDFDRDPRTMVAITEAPFYAAAVWPIVANTQGGPVHDARQRIMSVHNRPIHGLYAAGELGSIFGHLYLAGGNLAECFVGGQIAGQEAALRANGNDLE